MKDIRAKKSKIVNSKTLLVGIDIGKDIHSAICVTSEDKRSKAFSFSNNIHGFNILWERIKAAKEAYGSEDVTIGFESTGVYAESLIGYLVKKDVGIVQVNPLHTKRVKEINDNTPCKSDKKDPGVIVDIMKLGHGLSVARLDGPAAELRRLNNNRQRLIRDQVALTNRLNALMHLIFPEFLKIMRGVRLKSSLYLIEHYPTPEKISSLGYRKLSRILRKVSYGMINDTQANELIKSAEESVGIKEGVEGILMEIRQIVDQLKLINEFISDVEVEMHKWVTEIPYSKNLLSVKGIGLITVASLIGDVGDFKRYTKQSEILKLAGLNLYEKSSGKHQGERHISKMGRSGIRRALFFAALNTVRENGVMHNYYSRLIDRGMKKTKALVAVSRKLLMLMHALVRDDSYYQEGYNHHNGYVHLKEVA